MSSMRRGEIRLCRFAPPDKRRPVLLLMRDDVVGQLREVIVAPITRTVRGLRSEVVLTPSDGMPATCAINFGHVGGGAPKRSWVRSSRPSGQNARQRPNWRCAWPVALRSDR